AAFYYDEAEKAWKSLGGDFLNDKKVFKFTTNHFTKFTIAELCDEDNNNANNNGSANNGKGQAAKSNKNGKVAKSKGANRTGDTNSVETTAVLAVLALGAAVIMVTSIRRRTAENN
ncbi:MAG: hypothetical protein PUE01_10880, partial [Clostridiaceae bacterium]|nr:hypothetical protein [Clostridiaceae bacterium]